MDGTFGAFIEFERIDEEFTEEFDSMIEEFDSLSGRGATTKRITAATRMFAGSMDGVLSNSTHLLGAHGK